MSPEDISMRDSLPDLLSFNKNKTDFISKCNLFIVIQHLKNKEDVIVKVLAINQLLLLRSAKNENTAIKNSDELFFPLQIKEYYKYFRCAYFEFSLKIKWFS